MNLSAIYHRCQDNYCYCLDEDTIVISIRTGYEIEQVTLLHTDPFKTGIMGGGHRLTGTPLKMTEKKRLENHIYWTARIKPKFKRLAYYFLIETENEQIYLYEDRFYTPDEVKSYTGRQQLFMFPWMNPSDIIRTPDWVNQTIWYQIFIDRFCNGNKEIDPKNVKPWRAPDKSVHPFDYYGGDLVGITSKLDYLSKLGITGIYLTPICKGKSNHKYDTVSYTQIDPHFGSDEDMALMVKNAHKRGIRVMMDGVFNHSGAFFKPWRDVLKNGPESKYYDWFMINKWPLSKTGRNAVNGYYYAFAFVDGMPKLNTNNPKVIRYILKVISSWIKKYDIDAIRLDVAGEISHTLCKAMHKTLKSLKPDFYILGETWHDSIPWLRGDEFDSVMNYPFTDSVNDFWLDQTKTSTDFEYAINRCFTLYPEQINQVLFNLLDSHDTIRLVTKLKSIPKFYQQLSVLFTMPGTVCIYYGTEIAMEGNHDPDCRRCMPWAQIMKGEYYDKISIIKKLIHLRKTIPALRSNDYEFVDISSVISLPEPPISSIESDTFNKTAVSFGVTSSDNITVPCEVTSSDSINAPDEVISSDRNNTSGEADISCDSVDTDSTDLSDQYSHVISYIRKDDSGNAYMVIINCAKISLPININKNDILFALEYKNKELHYNGVLIYRLSH